MEGGHGAVPLGAHLHVGDLVAALVGLASLAGLAPKRVLPVFGLRSAIPAEREIFVVPDGERAAVFDESLQLLRSVLEQQDVAFAGDYFAVPSAFRLFQTSCASFPLSDWNRAAVRGSGRLGSSRRTRR